MRVRVTMGSGPATVDSETQTGSLEEQVLIGALVPW